MYEVLISSDRQLYRTVYNADISQATYQFYIILNKFCKSYLIPYYKNSIYTALHLVLSSVEMAWRWSVDQNVVIIK